MMHLGKLLGLGSSHLVDSKQPLVIAIGDSANRACGETIEARSQLKQNEVHLRYQTSRPS